MKDCACGCGETLRWDSTWNFIRGHKPKKEGATPRVKREAPAPEPELMAEEEPIQRIRLELTEEQLERIWQGLPLPEKGLAIQEALLAER